MQGLLFASLVRFSSAFEETYAVHDRSVTPFGVQSQITPLLSHIVDAHRPAPVSQFAGQRPVRGS